MSAAEAAYQCCINPSCAATFGVAEVLHTCPRCDGLLDVAYDWDRLEAPDRLDEFELRWTRRRDPLALSGVWRFKALLNFAPYKLSVTIGEGQTLLRRAANVASHVGVRPESLFLQYEGLNPTGSFKDNGMAAAFTHANLVGARLAACASTGNTSASLAAFASATQQMKALVFIGTGKIAIGKLAQALEYGATTLQIAGDFDDAMKMVRTICTRLGIYLVNSLNPFRLEGQKTIMYRVLEGLGWQVPDWIIVPGGNLGNSSAFGKAFRELYDLGLIQRLPRLAVICAAGAPTLNVLYNERGIRWNEGQVDFPAVERYYAELDAAGARAHTVASAIEINRPVNLPKCLRSLAWMDGVVRTVSDQEILDAKAIVGRAGIGCEPASAASVAGLKRLVAEEIVGPDERVVCVLTGHPLKATSPTVHYHADSPAEMAEALGPYGVRDAPFANRPISVANDIDEVIGVLEREVKIQGSQSTVAACQPPHASSH